MINPVVEILRKWTLKMITQENDGENLKKMNQENDNAGKWLVILRKMVNWTKVNLQNDKYNLSYKI